MIEKELQGQVRQALRKMVAALGEVVATCTVDDEIVHAIAGALGRVTDRRLPGGTGTNGSVSHEHKKSRVRSHPAVYSRPHADGEGAP